MPYITPELRLCLMVCFTTKRNYTTLKLAESIPDSPEVLLPKEITLLSNGLVIDNFINFVLLPKEITLLSNVKVFSVLNKKVLLPKEITLLSNNLRTLFAPCTGFTTKRNYTTLKLRKRLFSLSKCFTTKRNYTTLKLCYQPRDSQTFPMIFYSGRKNISRTGISVALLSV